MFYQVGRLTEWPDTGGHRIIYDINQSIWFIYLEDIPRIKRMTDTVCPGSSDPPEKIFHIFASENEVYT